MSRANIATQPARGWSAWQSDLLDHPRRLALRRAIFQVHLWCGLVVGLLATVAGVTGSAVVYREALDRRLAPALYRVSDAQALPAEGIVRLAMQQLPGYTLRSLNIEAGHAPWMLRVVSPTGVATTAFVDAANGHVLGARGERDGVMNWLDQLHTQLLGGRVGTWVNGAGAVGLLMLSVTGIVLWWPGRRLLRRSVQIHPPGRRLGRSSGYRSGSWRRFNWDVHTAGGFWVSLPLAVQAFTGVFLCFGFGWVLVLLGGRAAEFNNLVTAPPLTVACLAPLPLEGILNVARALQPNAVETFAIPPASPRDTLNVFLRSADDMRVGSVLVVAVNPCNAALVKVSDSRHASLALRTVLWLDAFHFGWVGGEWTRAAWVLLGLMPAALFVTGMVLWLRRLRRGSHIVR